MMPMDMRFLGRSGLQVSSLGFGAMTFGDVGNPGNAARGNALGYVGAQEAQRHISILLDAGINLFDTADVYALGRSEEILGAALKEKRKDVVIATKAFGRMSPATHDAGLSRRHLIAACEDSLRRLDTDWIDLYQVHSFDTFVPLEETLRALDALVTSGKIRYIGCSNFAAWQLMKALAISGQINVDRFISQQIQYSLMVRDAENEMLPCGVDQGVGALIWSPLAQGFLSGKFRRGNTNEDSRLHKAGRLSAYDDARGNAVLDALLTIADARGVSGTQVALNWLRARPGVTSVLFGARTEAQLRDNLAALNWSITADEVARLDKASQIDPPPYPAYFYRNFAPDRNPMLFAHYPPGT
jgi:aryl-alcohol dehydrogenase-like predicted oxidoreductase